jgi:hypothetical protein
MSELYFERPQLTAELLEFQFFWDVVLCHWVLFLKKTVVPSSQKKTDFLDSLAPTILSNVRNYLPNTA